MNIWHKNGLTISLRETALLPPNGLPSNHTVLALGPEAKTLTIVFAMWKAQEGGKKIKNMSSQRIA